MKRQEQQLQIACVRWFSLQYPTIAPLLHHSPNGGYRTAAEGRIFKAMGVRAGFPDLILCIPNKHYGCLMVEMKAGSGKQTESQRLYQELATKAGNLYVVAKDVTTFIDLVNSYLRDVR